MIELKCQKVLTLAKSKVCVDALFAITGTFLTSIFDFSQKAVMVVMIQCEEFIFVYEQR